MPVHVSSRLGKGRMLAGVGVPDMRAARARGRSIPQIRLPRGQENEQLVISGFWDRTHDPCYRPEKYKTISPSRQLLRNRLDVDKAARNW